MRILQIIADADLKSGGATAAVMSYSELLMEMGHAVEIATLEDEILVAARLSRVPVRALGRGWGRIRINFAYVAWLRRNAANYDAIIVNGFWNFTSIGAWLALRKLRVPYYLFAHGMLASWFRDQFPVKHRVKQLYWRLFEGRTARDAQAVFFTCEEERRDARGVFRGHSYNERVVRCGIRPPMADPEDERVEFLQICPELRGKSFLLCLCRIHPIKGCDLLLEALADCAAVLPSDVALVLAGPNQVGWLEELQGKARRLGIDRRVFWPGMLKGAAKWGALRMADAMILPSHHENFGFVVPEAMACGAPVLISDKVNIWREVEACGGGLIEPDTRQGTANLMRRFYQLTAEERSRMALAAREGFQKNFDAEGAARDFARAIGAEVEEAREVDAAHGLSKEISSGGA